MDFNDLKVNFGAKCGRASYRVVRALYACVGGAGKSLSELVVRRNAVRQRSDWPCVKSSSWTAAFYGRLRRAALSYEQTEREIAHLLDVPRWSMLPDRLFRHVHV